ncbi:hypothetical protein P7B02_16210 [Caulobacter segnis]|uniref:hypothetical protein n=1 Tax=Caulobacter segnis TaxID=88688 RepID=UPI00240EFC60|nr:hypothetical protein [Caulobacter segnis]MDG2523080.1 hypothetical protein [Caulobacter segnis]
MTEFARLLVMLAVAATAVTFAGSLARWLLDEDRRIRRALSKVLGGAPDAFIVAKGRGRGVGFRLTSGLIATTWDKGGWCLIFRLNELVGAELLVDGQSVGRVFRDEPKRFLDRTYGEAQSVVLRLVFDDPKHADFELALWIPSDAALRSAPTAAKAAQEANSWLARIEAILKRAPGTRNPPPPTPIARREAAPPTPAPQPVYDDFDDEDEEDEAAFHEPPPPPRPQPPRAPAPKAAKPPAPAKDALPLFADVIDDDPPWDEDDGKEPRLF